MLKRGAAGEQAFAVIRHLDRKRRARG